MKSDFIHIFHFIYSPGAGADNPLGTKFSCSQGHLVLSVILLQVSKNISLKSDFIHFFMILYMYVTPGQGLTAPRGQSFDVNRNVSSLCSFVARLKKTLKFDFIQFLNDLIHV